MDIDIDIDLLLMGGLAFLAVAAFLIVYLPKFSERLAFLAAVCAGAIAIIFVLQALR
jgi:hypothetical protein